MINGGTKALGAAAKTMVVLLMVLVLVVAGVVVVVVVVVAARIGYVSVAKAREVVVVVRS